mmetsp:Transcript_14319/g.27225  ORF Transcript_14319/g.27225 Transcript_14319/m.27225 type:complete len:438 (-) Transcript_14319:97-1410(-)
MSAPAVAPVRRKEAKLGANKTDKKSKYNGWVSRVYNVQKTKITPELRKKMKARAAVTQRLTRNTRKCNKLKLFSKQSNKAWSAGYSKVQKAQKEAKRVGRKASYSKVAEKELGLMQQLQRQLSDEEDDYAAIYDDIAVAEAAEEVDQSEIAEILRELEREPTDDEETKTKFALYETFLQTVEQIRKETFTFWGEAKQDFEGNSSRQVEKALKRIDNPNNMMVDFDGPRWFVHGMTCKAQSNRDKITAVLQMVQDKLKLLSGQDECPICLDSFQPKAVTLKDLIEEAKLEKFEKQITDAKNLDPKALLSNAEKDTSDAFWANVAKATGLKPGHLQRLRRAAISAAAAAVPKPVHTLGCCHKVCKECWDNYAQMNAKAKCPLCRDQDFLQDMAQEFENLQGAGALPVTPAPAPALALSPPCAVLLRRAAAAPAPRVAKK